MTGGLKRVTFRSTQISHLTLPPVTHLYNITCRMYWPAFSSRENILVLSSSLSRCAICLFLLPPHRSHQCGVETQREPPAPHQMSDKVNNQLEKVYMMYVSIGLAGEIS